MAVSVIPAIRTPRGVECFNYEAPPGMSVSPGDLVRVPFRKTTVIGIIIPSPAASETRDAAARRLKNIESLYGALRLNARTRDALNAVAERTLTSRSSVLHAWLGTLPKHPKSAPVRPVQAALLPTREDRLLTNRFLAPNGIVSAVKRLTSEGKRVLVLTPWAARAAWLARLCNADLLTGELAPGDRFRAWAGFLRGHVRALVATRVGAWLSTESDIVILDEPENDDHKQDELAPRFDARWLAYRASQNGVGLLTFGLTPRLDGTAATIPSLNPRVSFIDVQRADWSPVSCLQRRTMIKLEQALAAKRPIFILHSIYGERARLRCADCGWTADCARCGAGLNAQTGKLVCLRCGLKTETRAVCPVCGGVNLSRARPGREKLERDLIAHGFMNEPRSPRPTCLPAGRRPHAPPACRQAGAPAQPIRILSLGDWNALSELPDNACVVVTDLSLIAGAGEDARRRERLMIAWRRLADFAASNGAELAVQADGRLLAQARSWLTADGCESAWRQELSERERFSLPPAARLVKIILRGPEAGAQNTLASLRAHAEHGSSLLGPYAVQNRPNTRIPRWTAHLVLQRETEDSVIFRLIEPLFATDALIDLDPIAFFE